MKPLISIQYLRAAAALGVVAYHAAQWRTGGFDVGRAGVDLFFVISGVIMWKVTGRREGAPGGFLWLRVTRVAPLYWLVTLVLTGVALAWPEFLANVHPDPAHVLLSLGFVPHLDPKGLPFPLFAPGWSLDYEAIFYLVFAAALFAPRRCQAALVCSGLFLIVAAGFILDDPIYILGANPMMLQFAAGVGIANLSEMDGLPGRRGGAVLIFAGLVGLAVPAVLGLFSEFWRPFIWGVPATLIVGGALAIEGDREVKRWPALSALGDASYALYLVHEPAQALVAHTLGAANPWLFYPAAITASIAAGLACHRWVERPLIKWARSPFRRARGSEDEKTKPGRSPPSPSPAERAS